MTQFEFSAALSLTRIESLRIRRALKAHLVDGVQKSIAAERYQVDKSLMSKRVSRVKGVHFELKSYHRNISRHEATL